MKKLCYYNVNTQSWNITEYGDNSDFALAFAFDDKENNGIMAYVVDQDGNFIRGCHGPILSYLKPGTKDTWVSQQFNDPKECKAGWEKLVAGGYTRKMQCYGRPDKIEYGDRKPAKPQQPVPVSAPVSAPAKKVEPAKKNEYVGKHASKAVAVADQADKTYVPKHAAKAASPAVASNNNYVPKHGPKASMQEPATESVQRPMYEEPPMPDYSDIELPPLPTDSDLDLMPEEEELVMTKEDRMFTIAYTGHRPKDLLGYNADYSPILNQITNHLEQTIAQHPDEKITVITGGAQGIDQLAFQAANDLKKKQYNIKTVIAVPFIGQEKRWPELTKFGQKEYREILAKADHVEILSDNNNDAIVKLNKRNEWMVDHSDLLICVTPYDNIATRAGGTGNCLRYAIASNHDYNICHITMK